MGKILKYNEESEEWYFLEVDVQYIEKLHEFHNDLRLLPERMKIQKVKKLVANLNYKTEYFIGIRNLKQALNHGLVFKKLHKVIQFNQNAWLNPYIDINTDLRKKKKQKWLWKSLIMQFMEKSWKMWENIKILNCHNRKMKKLFGVRTKW